MEDNMPSTKQIVLSLLGLLLLAFVLTWIVQGGNFFLYKYWAPKQAAVQREVFENTPSYTQGTVQELQNMQFQYEATTNENSKAALADIILRRAAAFPDDQLAPDLRAFIQGLKARRLGAGGNAFK